MNSEPKLEHIGCRGTKRQGGPSYEGEIGYYNRTHKQNGQIIWIWTKGVRPIQKDDPWGDPYFMGPRSEASAAKLRRSMAEHGQSEPIERPYKRRKRSRSGAVGSGNEGYSASTGPGGYNSGGGMEDGPSFYHHYSMPGPRFQYNEPRLQPGHNRSYSHQPRMRGGQPRNPRAHSSRNRANNRQQGMGGRQSRARNGQNQSYGPQSGMGSMGAGIGKEVGAGMGASMGASMGVDIEGMGASMGARYGAEIGGRLGAEIGAEIEKRLREQLRPEMGANMNAGRGAAMEGGHGYYTRVKEVEEDDEVEFLGEKMTGQPYAHRS